MTIIEFHELNAVEDKKLGFAVIMARYEGKWIMVRHKERATWEIPGGHREEPEDIQTTAARELMEETGAEVFSLVPICVYSVLTGETKSYGLLAYAEVSRLGKLPEFEIAEIRLFETIPENLTYPHIQPYLYERIKEAMSSHPLLFPVERGSER